MTMIEYLERLTPMSEELKKELMRVIEARNFAKRELIVRPGRASAMWWFIQQGVVSVFYERDDRIAVSALYTENCMLPFDLDTEGVEAIEAVTAQGIAVQELDQQVHVFPEWGMLLRQLMEEECRQKEQRFRAFHHQRPIARYRWLLKHHPELVQRVSNTHLASYMGMSLETLSRLKSRL